MKGEHGLAELSPVFPALNKGVPAYLHLIGVDKFFSSRLVTLSHTYSSNFPEVITIFT